MNPISFKVGDTVTIVKSGYSHLPKGTILTISNAGNPPKRMTNNPHWRYTATSASGDLHTIEHGEVEYATKIQRLKIFKEGIVDLKDTIKDLEKNVEILEKYKGHNDYVAHKVFEALKDAIKSVPNQEAEEFIHSITVILDANYGKDTLIEK